MVRIVPFEAWHYLLLADHAYPWEGLPWRPDPLRFALWAHENGPAWTGFEEETMLGSAGVILRWPGLGYAWAVLTPAGRRRPIPVHRGVRRHFEDIIVKESLRRIDAEVLQVDRIACRWLERLGFQVDGEMPAFGPRGEPFVRYVRLIGDH